MAVRRLAIARWVLWLLMLLVLIWTAASVAWRDWSGMVGGWVAMTVLLLVYAALRWLRYLATSNGE